MLRQHLYEAYLWRVRHFKDGETNGSTIRFTPDGRPYGFVERLKEDAPGPALDAAAARRIAEEGATRWNVDLAKFSLAEAGQERRPSGRVDHTFTYERSDATLKGGRYRLRLGAARGPPTRATPLTRVPAGLPPPFPRMRAGDAPTAAGPPGGAPPAAAVAARR